MIGMSIRVLRGLCVGLAGAALFGAGMALGYIIAPQDGSGDDIQAQHESGAPYASATDISTEKPDAAAVGASEIIVGVNTRAVFSYTFSGCGHTLDVLTDDVTGMNESDVRTAYPNKRIVEFTQEQVVLLEKLDGCCPMHYYVRLENGRVVVTRRDEQTLDPCVVAEFSPPETSDEQLAELTEGLVFDCLEDINVYFESYGS